MTVLGGGLAGLAAACELADRGFAVTLVERRPYLGGRASSYFDRGLGLWADLGQHLFLGCCTYYTQLLEKLGASGYLHRSKALDLPILWGGPRPGPHEIFDFVGYPRPFRLRAWPLPAPFHLFPAVLGFPSLSPPEKLLIFYALARIRATDRRSVAGESFYRWLRRHRQGERAIRDFWEFILLPILNTRVREGREQEGADAELALMAFQEGFLADAGGSAIGYARVGLTRLLEGARAYLEERGGQLLVGSRALGLRVEAGEVTGAALADGSLVEADYFVSALPPEALLPLLPEAWRSRPFFARLADIPPSPIVNIYILYDRPVTDLAFAACLGSPVQWLFNKGRLWGEPGLDGRYLGISLSAAREFIAMADGELRSLFEGEMARLFPRARQARTLAFRVVRQPRATFAAVPGIGRLRPPPETPLANLLLAGDWTATGWPGTMEGAVRSGIAGARRIAASARERPSGVPTKSAISWGAPSAAPISSGTGGKR